MAKRIMLSIQATPDIKGIRTAELFSQEHTVIPAIVLVEGVLWPANAPGPELALAEEFGRFPDGWNGRPVVFDHPRVNGEPVSASSPAVLEDNAFGQLFNTTLVGGKLKTEIWINEARVTKLGEAAQAVIQGLKDGTGVAEVSTGLFTLSEPVKGIFNGKQYESIWRNIVPDHLAVLPEGIKGACSVADGCGAPRANKGGGGSGSADWEPVMRAAQLNSDCNCPAGETKGIFQRMFEIAGEVFSFKSSSKNLSDSDLRKALNTALSATEQDSFFFILAVYPDMNDSGKFVYEVGFDGALFERDFSIASGGAISMGKGKVAVRPVTTFVPVVITDNNVNDITQENVMSKEKLVNELVANTATQYTEEDREWLSSLEEVQLVKMAPKAPKASEAPAVAAAPIAASATQAASVVEAVITAAAKPKPINTDEYIANAPDEIRQVLTSSLQMHRQRKAGLIDALTANARCKFSKESLEARSIEELENIVALAADISYEGSGTVLTNRGNDDNAIPPALEIFPTNKAAAA